MEPGGVMGFTPLLVKDLVITKYGKSKWEDIIYKSTLDDNFNVHTKYPQEAFDKLAGAACEVLKLSVDELLEVTGYWFYFFSLTNYKDMIKMVGRNLPELIQNLNKIHMHVRSTFPPNTRTPAIWGTDATNDSMVVHYIPSDPSRIGWTSFLIGALRSFAENHFHLRSVTTHVLEKASEGAPHDRILLSWSERVQSCTFSDMSSTSSSLSPPSNSRHSSHSSHSNFSGRHSQYSLQTTYQYGMSPDIFAAMFPFHVIFGRDMNIKQMGCSIAGMLPFVSVGDSMSQIFSIESPANLQWDFDAVRHHVESLFVIQFEVNFEPPRKVTMQGQMVFTKSPDNEELIYFLGSVDVRSPEEASYLGLSMSSYALHDARIYLIFSTASSKSVAAEKELLEKEMEELRRTVSCPFSPPPKEKQKVSFFRKLFPSNSNNSIPSVQSAPSLSSVASFVRSPSKDLSSISERDDATPQSPTTQKLLADDYIKNMPNAVERQEIFNIFMNSTDPELETAAGKAICTALQNAKDDAQVEKLSLELMETDSTTKLLQFLDKNVKLYVHTAINPEEVQTTDVLGRGSLGVVYAALFKGKPVAAKILKSKHLAPHEYSDFRRELTLMTVLRHKNLLNCYGGHMSATRENEYTPLLLMPVMQSTLHSNLHNPDIKYTWNDKINILKSIAEGMSFLHKYGLLHRDLKSINCLMNSPTDVKLSDFGLSRLKDNQMTKAVGTISWMAPEVLFGQVYSFSADVYSFGIIVWEVLTGKEPYYDQSDRDLYLYIRKGGRPSLPKKPTSVQQPVIKLIEKYWQTNAKKRGTFEEVLDSLKLLEKEITH